MHSFLTLKASLLPLSFNAAQDTEPASFAAYRALYQLDAMNSSCKAQHRIGTVPCGDHRLAVQYWLPDNAIATVLVVHGYYDHIGLYRHVIRFFLKQGYAVIGFDLPGHGLSSGPRAVISDFDEYGRAIHDVIRAASPHFPPVTTGFGQSTGCAALMNYLMAGFDSTLEKLVLFSPLLRPHKWQEKGRWTYTFLRHWVKTVPRVFQTNSGDPDFLYFCQHRDSLQPRLLTVAWVAAMKNWIDRFADQPEIHLPTLIVQGQQDDTVDWGFNIPAILEKIPKAQLQYIGEARHHLANETPAIRAHLWQIVNEFLQEQEGHHTHA